MYTVPSPYISVSPREWCRSDDTEALLHATTHFTHSERELHYIPLQMRFTSSTFSSFTYISYWQWDPRAVRRHGPHLHCCVQHPIFNKSECGMIAYRVRVMIFNTLIEIAARVKSVQDSSQLVRGLSPSSCSDSTDLCSLRPILRLPSDKLHQVPILFAKPVTFSRD